jgi:hypothetical protein
MSADTLNFLTTSLACCGLSCDTVDFAYQDNPDDPRRKKTCHPRFWWGIEKMLSLADLANFVFDSFFVQKLQDERHDTWALVLLCATITTFVGTMVIGRALLNHIKAFDVQSYGTARTVYKEEVYYGFWSLMEVGAFLLEDASTLYLYFTVEEGIFDNNNALDVGNVYMSMFSGFVSLTALLLMTSTVCGLSKKCYHNLILFCIAGLLVACPSYLTLHYSIPGREDEEDVEFPEVALGVSSFWGFFFFVHLVFGLLCHKCCGDQGIEWPTEIGMIRQGDLKTRRPRFNGGIGSPNNLVKDSSMWQEGSRVAPNSNITV